MVTSEQLPLFHRTICVLTDDSSFHCGEKSPCFRRSVALLAAPVGYRTSFVPEMNHPISYTDNSYRVLYMLGESQQESM